MRRGSLILVLVACSSVIAIIIALTSVAIIQSKERARNELNVTASNLTSLLALEINNSVQEIDRGLLSIRDEVSRQTKTGHKNDQAILEVISREDSRYPDSRGFCVFGPDGRLRYGAKNIVSRSDDVSQRDEFIQLKGTTDANFIVTPPIPGPMENEWLIAVAHRITNSCLLYTSPSPRD